MMEQGDGNSPTVWVARTQSGDERRRRAEADAEAAAEEVRHAGLAAELAAAQAEIGALRHAHSRGGGSEPQAEPASAAPAQLGAVRSEGDGTLLTLVCLRDGAAVQLPLAAAAAESELVRSMLEDAEDGATGTVLEVGLGGRQAAAFAAFLHDPVAVAGRGQLGFAALFNAACFLMAPRWQQQLADAWGAELVKPAGRGNHGAVAAAAERAEAALDPAVSPLLTLLPAKAVSLLVFAPAGGQPGQRVVAGWAERELETPRRRAEGWLVVGGGQAGGRQAKESGAAHLVIRPGTTKIDNYAFEDCTAVVSVAIPASVTQIGGYAFSGCSAVVSVAIPASVTEIGSGAFYKCRALVSVAIPASVTEIGDYAFAECSSVVSVAIPASVTQMGYRAFANCSALPADTVSELRARRFGQWIFGA